MTCVLPACHGAKNDCGANEATLSLKAFVVIVTLCVNVPSTVKVTTGLFGNASAVAKLAPGSGTAGAPKYGHHTGA